MQVGEVGAGSDHARVGDSNRHAWGPLRGRRSPCRPAPAAARRDTDRRGHGAML